MKLGIVFPANWQFNRRLERLFTVGTRLDAEIHVICRNRDNQPSDEQISSTLWVHRLPHFPGSGILSSQAFFLNPLWAWTIRKVCRRYRIEMVIVREFPLTLLTRLVVGKRVPIVVDMGENYIAMTSAHPTPRQMRYRLINRMFTSSFGHWVERLSCSVADGILVVVEENRDRLVAFGTPPAKVLVFHNVPVPERMIAQAKTRAELGVSAEELFVAYLGDISFVRGITDAIAAAAELKRQAIKSRFLLMGDYSTMPNLRELVRELGVESEVVLTGQVPYRQGLGCIEAADVCVLPHVRSEHTETTVPNKLFDYMYFSKPVVVSDVSPLARIVTTHDCGLVFRSGDARDLAEKLKRLALDPELRRVLGTNGRRAIETHYNWSRYQEDLCRFLKRLMPQAEKKVRMTS
jgi:glycosyltransferase involved in cell wall biosynthesis